MIDWIRDHDTALWWLAALSVATFLGTLAAVPALVVRIPTDYFSHRRRHRTAWDERHPVVRLVGLIIKNIVGGLFIAAGVAMLFLPGQGVLTILIGIMLTDFPGKYRFERWLVERPPVLRAINWLRRRAGRPPLEMPRRVLRS